jgi:predicted nucleic acid-binding protein
LKVYIDTSVIISLTDPLDIFHNESVTFIDNLTRHRIECNVSTPLIVEPGRIVEIKGVERSLDVINAINNFEINFKNADIEEVWNLSQAYLDADTY